MLLLLSGFSCVRLCATPEMAAHQAPLSLVFSRMTVSFYTHTPSTPPQKEERSGFYVSLPAFDIVTIFYFSYPDGFAFL